MRKFLKNYQTIVFGSETFTEQALLGPVL